MRARPLPEVTSRFEIASLGRQHGSRIGTSFASAVLRPRKPIRAMKVRAAVQFLAFATGAALSLGGCASMQNRVEHKEDLLAAAGFDVHLAKTPEREAALKRLPSNKFVTRAKNDHIEYLYADPLVCAIVSTRAIRRHSITTSVRSSSRTSLISNS